MLSCQNTLSHILSAATLLAIVKERKKIDMMMKMNESTLLLYEGQCNQTMEHAHVCKIYDSQKHILYPNRYFCPPRYELIHM